MNARFLLGDNYRYLVYLSYLSLSRLNITQVFHCIDDKKLALHSDLDLFKFRKVRVLEVHLSTFQVRLDTLISAVFQLPPFSSGIVIKRPFRALIVRIRKQIIIHKISNESIF